MTRYNYTGDALTTGNTVACFVIPHAQKEWLLYNLMGVIEELTHDWAWVENGETTSQEAALFFGRIYDGMFVMSFEVGDIKNTASHNAPTLGTWLLCDGSQYAQALYPELYAAIGGDWNVGGVPTGYFAVPDLRGRIQAMVDVDNMRISAAFAHNLGGTGGEDTHVLDTTEMPSHGHTDTGHIHTTGNSATAVSVTPGELPTLVPNPLPAFTGSASANLTNTGGGMAHNNVQPTAMVWSYILARM